MDVFIALTEHTFDVQADVHLVRGDIAYSAGPDRAYLIYPYRHPHGYDGEEVVALWRIDTEPLAQVLATGLGAPDPQGCAIKPFHVRWIRDGRLAVRSAPIGIDRALWLVSVFVKQDLLDRTRSLFGAEVFDISNE